jgi:hypothetical protein
MLTNVDLGSLPPELPPAPLCALLSTSARRCRGSVGAGLSGDSHSCMSVLSNLPTEQPSPESFGAFSLQLRPESRQLLLRSLAIILTFGSLAFYVSEEAFTLFA